MLGGLEQERAAIAYGCRKRGKVHTFNCTGRCRATCSLAFATEGQPVIE